MHVCLALFLSLAIAFAIFFFVWPLFDHACEYLLAFWPSSLVRASLVGLPFQRAWQHRTPRGTNLWRLSCCSRRCLCYALLVWASITCWSSPWWRRQCGGLAYTTALPVRRREKRELHANKSTTIYYLFFEADNSIKLSSPYLYLIFYIHFFASEWLCFFFLSCSIYCKCCFLSVYFPTFQFCYSILLL